MTGETQKCKIVRYTNFYKGWSLLCTVEFYLQPWSVWSICQVVVLAGIRVKVSFKTSYVEA